MSSRTEHLVRSPPRKRGSGASLKSILAISSLLSLSLGTALAADPPPGASSCSGCHPASSTVETSAGRLNGRSPADIVTAVATFRSGQRPATVMDRIAKGFTDDEIKAIADWYAAQKD
jgi:cytochrome subunit of sulfide dehydrogenase